MSIVYFCPCDNSSMVVLCHAKVDVSNAVCGQVVVVPERFVHPFVWFRCCYLLSIVRPASLWTKCFKSRWTYSLSRVDNRFVHPQDHCVDKLYVHLILVPGHFKVWTKKLVGHSDEWTIKVGASSHRSKRTWTLYLRIIG